MKQQQKLMVNISKYIKALLHSASGHQGSRKAHQAGNQVQPYPSGLLHWRRGNQMSTKPKPVYIKWK